MLCRFAASILCWRKGKGALAICCAMALALEVLAVELDRLVEREVVDVLRNSVDLSNLRSSRSSELETMAWLATRR